MIEVRDLKKTYRLGDSEVRALDGVSLDVAPGEFVAVMGASGSGKSTLLQVLGLLDTPDSGSYQLQGKEVAGLSEDELATLRSQTLGFVFQQFNLLARTTAADQVRLPRLYTPRPEPAGQAERLLDKVGLGERKHHTPAQLSGGQQQRVAIARALMNDPKLIFADEPTGNLDSKSSQEILDLLCDLNDQGITILMVTHEADIAARAKRVIVMKDGKVLSDKKNGGKRAHTGASAPSPQEGGPARSQLTALGIYASQAWTALWANKVRTALSVLGILIGVAAVIAMLAVGAGAQKAVKAQLASLGSNLLILNPGASNRGGVSQGGGSASIQLKLDDATAIAKAIPQLSRVSPEVEGRVQAVAAGKNWNTRATGAGVDYPAMRAAVPALGRFFTAEEYRARARVAVIGVTVARNLFGEDNPLGKTIKLNRVSFQVIGVLPAKGSSGWRDQDDAVVMPTTTAMYRVLGKPNVDNIAMEVASETQVPEAIEEIKAFMRDRIKLAPGKEDPFNIFNLSDIQAAVQSTSKTMTLMLSSIAAISLLVGGIGIMNIMLVSVTERTREIGLRKALGAKRGDILFQFLVESVVVSVAGGLAGVALGALITLLVGHFAGWTMELSMGAVALAIGFSAFVGIAFGLWPARKASLLRPIEALRYE